MTYRAPVQDILFAMKASGGLDQLIESGVYGDVDEDLIGAVLEEAGKFASDVLAPLNHPGDQTGSHLADGKVVLPEGWKEAYTSWAEAEWGALPCSPDHGGQGLPSMVSMGVCEIWNAANTSFGLAPLLTQGAVDAIHQHGSEELKENYLPNMVAGKWTGTMNLTEPQAGSDLSAIRTRAEPQEDGTYRISGTKIFITYGDHEMTENIIHLVLARLPDAPEGTKGISLFLVPKYLVNDDGSIGERNDVHCSGLEHKLGIHASPTCVMSFGEKDGAVGYLVGELNQGLKIMFIMMNAARLAVGVQGVAVAEAATQKAMEYAHERRQGKSKDSPAGEMTEIIAHPDIRRTLMSMKALTAAARAICLATSAATDVMERANSKEMRSEAADRTALLTPIAKAFSTDIGVEVASMGIQVHGGMGFIEETGAAQYYRDARILPIYEGTNGIQAMDLVFRKLPLGGGAAVKAYIGELGETAREVSEANVAAFGDMGERLGKAVEALQKSTVWLGENMAANQDAVLACATPYLKLFGLASGGHYLARAALAASRSGDAGLDHHIALARFFVTHHVSEATGLADLVMGGDLLVDRNSRLFAI